MAPIVDMIDIHSHILPGMDDGARTMEESLQMCRTAYEDGIRTIVATPHSFNGIYQNGRLTILSKLAELNSELQTKKSELPLRILPGSDIYLCEKTLEHVDQGEAVTIGDGGKYIMIEFPSQMIPHQAERVLFQLLGSGLIPIVSHPERNLEIMKRPERYYKIIKMGCLGQVTAMSLTGEFGPKVKQFSEKLLKGRLVHFIASDAHSINGRSPILSAAVKAAAKIVGKEEAEKMVTEYPRAILEGKKPDLPDPISSEPARRRLW